MTQKDRENRFIAKCKKDFGSLSYESELLLRHGYAAGAAELERVAFAEGVEMQRDRVLGALGALGAAPEKVLP